jgi:hypothetical protein
MTFRACVLGLLLLISGIVARLGAIEPITLKVSPSVSFAPANLIVRAMVEASADNRAVLLEADSESFYRSSEISLDGDRAPRTNTFEFRNLPHGTYEIKATLIGPGRESRAMVRQQINVIENGSGR